MKDSFIFYNDFFEVLFALDDMGRTEILRAIQAHTQGTAYTLPPPLAVVFIPIRQKLDKDSLKYQEICRARSAAGKKGGRPPRSLQIAQAEDTTKKQKLSPKTKEPDSECDKQLLSIQIDNNIEKENISSSEKQITEKDFTDKFNRIKALLLDSHCWIETMMKNHGIPDGGIENALQQFHDHIVSIGKETSLTGVREAKMWFNSWASKGYLQHLPPGTVLGKGEFIENGRRVFLWGKEHRVVPPYAPPRPTESDYWNNEKQSWIFCG